MKGTFIAGMGLPGSGKSSVFSALADLLIRDGVSAQLYREPEEVEWPAAVMQRDTCGYISALTWFRAKRVPFIYQADADRACGTVALLDSYYDKLIALYFEDAGLEWLMPKHDPYRQAYKSIIELDHALLPDADCVVSLRVEADRWRELVLSRGRELDRSANILDTFPTQHSFMRAAEEYCRGRGIPHIVIDNKHGAALGTAVALREQLVVAGVLQ